MLWDERWDKPTKADKWYCGVSLLGLIAFLETKPADGEYDYADPFSCATAQYLMARGLTKRDEIGVPFGGTCAPTHPGYWLQNIVGTRPYTFGAALERARAINK